MTFGVGSVFQKLNRAYIKSISRVKIEIANTSRNVNIDASTLVYPSAQVLPSGEGSVNIGKNCIMQRQSIVDPSGGAVTIGANSTLNPYSIIYGHGGTTIGRGVRIAAHTAIIPANHIFENKREYIYQQGIEAEGIHIKDDVWIGSGCQILDDVVIGEGAVVGAGSVVTDNIPEYSVTAGTPAKVIKYR